jgi:gas vesicle protein
VHSLELRFTEHKTPTGGKHLEDLKKDLEEQIEEIKEELESVIQQVNEQIEDIGKTIEQTEGKVKEYD